MIDHIQLSKFRNSLSFAQQVNLLVYRSQFSPGFTFGTGKSSRQPLPPVSGQSGTGNGVDLQLITADAAYHDKDGSLYEETGAIVTTPPSSKVSLPEYIDTDTGSVFCNAECSVPMLHVGIENQDHEYKCSANPGECQFSRICPQYRFIAIDGVCFSGYPFIPI